MLWERMEHEVLQPDDRKQLLWLLDGKPLVISGCSKDRQSGYGRAAGGKAKGYKLHAIYGQNGTIRSGVWRP